MQYETLQASVQYGDFRGTAAADIAEQVSFESFAKQKGVDLHGGQIVGVQLYSGDRGFFNLHFLLAVGSTDGAAPIKYELIDVGATAQEALTLFKRFEIVLVSRNAAGRRFERVGEDE